MKKSLYRQVMFVISSICLILLITIAVKIGVFSELTSCVWIESILSVINNSYFSGVLCSIIAVIVIYFFQVQYSKRMLKKDVRCNEIIQDVYDGIEKYCNISNTIPERTSKNEEKDYSKSSQSTIILNIFKVSYYPLVHSAVSHSSSTSTE